MHLNALPFLEPPALVFLSLETLQFNGDIIEADIGLRHPFLGLTEFTGFDVCGVLISNGSISGFDDSALVMAGGDDTYLMNPDGLTRWWNPLEFPQDGTMFAYKDGLLGAPYSVGGFNSTLNGYKFFCDDLDDPDAPVGSLDPSDRCVFSAGQKNIRHYTIHMGSDGLIFNYAVDASWVFPQGDPPYQAPDDFPPAANRPEAWNIMVTEISNTMFNDGNSSGGGLSMMIEVWDHFDAALNNVVVESPSNFVAASSNVPVGGGEGYSVYQVDVIDATPAENSIDILIGVECGDEGYQGMIPGASVTAYFLHSAAVSSSGFMVISPNGGEEWESLSQQDITWAAPDSIQYVDIYYSKDDFVDDVNLIEADVPNTGTYDWYVPFDPSDTVKVRVEESGGGLQDDSDDYFTIVESGCGFGETGFTHESTYSMSGMWTYMGVKVTHQDPTRRVICQGSSDNNDTLYLFNASNPSGGAVASYDTGDLIYCNNNRAFWIDPVSIDGIDRIIYNNFGSGSPTDGYQLKTIDWDGSTFSNPQVLPKNGSIWNLCVTPEGDLISHDANTLTPHFFLRDKSDNYALTQLFTLQQSTCDFGTVSNLKDICYDSLLDAVVVMCRNTAVSNGGQLFVLDMSGNLLYQDLDIFGGELISYNTGVDVDINNPACRIIAYAGADLHSGTYWITRYSWDFAEKKMNQYAGLQYGPARGELCEDGTLWAAQENGNGILKFNPPVDW